MKRSVSFLLLVVACVSSACATVPQNRRAHFADPMMDPTGDRTELARRQKLYDTREGAAGGDGTPAGGGCGCQ
jgi:hypothetical protein